MRVNFNVPDELVARLDAYAKENYSSRSSVMCQACDQFLTAKEMQKMFGEMSRWRWFSAPLGMLRRVLRRRRPLGQILGSAVTQGLSVTENFLFGCSAILDRT